VGGEDDERRTEIQRSGWSFSGGGFLRGKGGSVKNERVLVV